MKAIEQLLDRREAMHRPYLVDLVLDAYSWLLSFTVLLERRSQLPGLFTRQAALFQRLTVWLEHSTWLTESASRCANWAGNDPTGLTDEERALARNFWHIIH